MSTHLYWTSAIGNPTLGRLLLSFINTRLLYSNSSEHNFSFDALGNSSVSERALKTLESIYKVFKVEPNSALLSKQLPCDESVLSLKLVDSFKIIADHQRDGHDVLKLSQFGLQIASQMFQACNNTDFGIVNLNQDSRPMLLGTNKTGRNHFSDLWLNSEKDIVFIINSNSFSETVFLEVWASGSLVEEIEISLEEILVLFFIAKWVIGSANGIANVSLLSPGHTILFKSIFCHTFSMLKEFGASSNVSIFDKGITKKKIIRTNISSRLIVNYYFRKVK